MQTKWTWAVLAMAIATLDGCSGAEETKPVDDMKTLMGQHVQTEAQVYWDAVQFISDENGVREIVPQNDAEWNRTVEAARNLKNWGESLKQPAHAQGKGTDWQDFAQGLVDSAGQAEVAALSHNPDMVLEAGGTLYNVCSACHEVYMPSPGGLAPTDQSNTKPEA